MFNGLFLFISLLSLNALSHPVATSPQTVITDLSVAKAVHGVILAEDSDLNVAVAHLSPDQLNKISILNHSQKKCAGFEVLADQEVNQPGFILNNLKQIQMSMFMPTPLKVTQSIVYNDSYKKISDQADPQKLKEMIQWLSTYPNRYNKSKTPNTHVEDLKNKLNEWLKDAPWSYTIETIVHKSTKQNSLKLTIKGTNRPNEIVVLGGHLDSINQGFFGFPIPGQDKAPGADDNASGSSNLIEAVKLLKQVQSFERTLEFYWYAGEESGLLGSAEIAQTAKTQNRNIIAVLQLDMTLFPGDGEQVIGLMTDFTSPWLRSILNQINDTYIKARFVESQCGYGCSDHASWNRQGYHAVIPFEATMSKMNGDIHTAKDVINSKSSLNHSNTFTKIATLFALTLANSQLQAP